MRTGHWIARAIPRACWWCVGLLPAISLVACGVAEPTSQAPTPSLRAADTTAPAPTLGSTVPPSPEPPGALPTRPASPVPATATLLPTSAAAGQISTATTVAMDAAATTPVPPPSPIPPLAAGAWQTYRNERAGFRVEHPADWTVSDQANADGSFVTTFSAAGGGPTIVVSSTPGQIVSDNDLPNTRCEQVTIGGLPGTRCFDTIARSTSVTLVGPGKTFTIAATSKHLDAQIFERFLDHFAPIAGP